MGSPTSGHSDLSSGCTSLARSSAFGLCLARNDTTSSALRHVVGSTTMDSVITEGRAALGIEVEERIQRYLDSYRTGIDVVKVNIDKSAPPSQVQDAFDDVQKAKEDEVLGMEHQTRP